MTYLGVSNGRGPGGRALVIDVGGGSTELVLGGPDGVAFPPASTSAASA